MHPNTKAFLSTIAYAEGTKDLADDGYNVLVGSRPRQIIAFSNYNDHPRIAVRVRRDNPATSFDEEIISTAAGRYQILERIYDHYKVQLKLKDFGPASQDAIALQLIRECDALQAILDGQLELAVTRCKSRWASFPGAGYNQREHSLLSLRLAYVDFGGTLS